MSRNQLWSLALLAALIAFAPLVWGPLTGTEFAFTGTDDQAAGLVGQLAPGYRPWAEPVWRPASPEVASFLFALQAAVGAGVLGYCIGYRRGRRRAGSEAEARGSQCGVGSADAGH